jgi:hypothetical protein
MSMIVINLETPKVGAKHELLFNKPASDGLIRVNVSVERVRELR